MKRKRIIGMMLLFILIGTIIFAQADAVKQITVPLTNPGKGYTLNASSFNGSIKVTGYNGKDILIDVTIETQKERRLLKDTINGMRRISTAGNYEVSADEKNNVVTINVGLANRAINLAIKLPQNVKLKLNAINHGAIEVNNVTGELEIKGVNGAIKLTNISGSVVANTINGSVTASFIKVDAKAPMAFSTLNGPINVTLPGDTKANLKIKTDKGEVFTDFEMDIDKTVAKMNTTNSQTMHVLKMENWINGKINGGGPEMLLKNMNGSIYLHKAK